jgi:hypothetical protein
MTSSVLRQLQAQADLRRRQVVITGQGAVALTEAPLEPMGAGQVLAHSVLSGISTGTNWGGCAGSRPRCTAGGIRMPGSTSTVLVVLWPTSLTCGPRPSCRT